MELLISTEEIPEKGVKSNEMIHVGMGHKDMGNPEQVSRRKKVQFTKIKHQRPFLKKKRDE